MRRWGKQMGEVRRSWRQEQGLQNGGAAIYGKFKLSRYPPAPTPPPATAPSAPFLSAPPRASAQLGQSCCVGKTQGSKRAAPPSPCAVPPPPPPSPPPTPPPLASASTPVFPLDSRVAACALWKCHNTNRAGRIPPPAPHPTAIARRQSPQTWRRHLPHDSPPSPLPLPCTALPRPSPCKHPPRYPTHHPLTTPGPSRPPTDNHRRPYWPWLFHPVVLHPALTVGAIRMYASASLLFVRAQCSLGCRLALSLWLPYPSAASVAACFALPPAMPTSHSEGVQLVPRPHHICWLRH
jgi:hypothetical protein